MGVKRLYKQLKKLTLTETKSQYEQQILALAALLCLAARKIMPADLVDKTSGKILTALVPEFAVDETRFAGHLTQVAQKNCLTADRRQIGSLKEILLQAGSQEIISSPLFVGWVYQCLSFERRNSFAQLDNYQRMSAEDIQMKDLAVLTQWFTPEWISKFLVSETMDVLEQEVECQFSFLDPCLGAGHIFVEALIERKKRLSYLPDKDALERILLSELFGCDLDKQVVEIAGFSIYLACRDLAPILELPLPQIFYFDKGVGSLCLDSPSENEALFSLGGKADINLLKRKYSAVITNPPYLSHRLMPKELSSYLKQNFYAGRFDLYAAFLELCMRLTCEKGVFALICQQSFMSITRYEQLRQNLLERFSLKTIVQLGSGVFASRKGEKVSNAILVAQLKKDESKTEGFRILSEHEQAIAQVGGVRKLPKVVSEAKAFEKFPGKQFAFWCPAEILRLFELPALESPETGINSVNGLFTCNNREFVKFFWQVEEAESNSYVPYDKGGGYKWYYTTPLRLKWEKEGSLIREYRRQRGQSAALPGEAYYFKEGVTYSYIGTQGFKARLLSPGSIFDIASSALFADDPYYLLGFLNSSLTRFILGLLNPTVNFQIGDLRRLPYKEPSLETRKTVGQAVSKAIEVAQQLETFDPQSPNYLGPVLLRYISSISEAHLVEACRLHREKLQELNEAEAFLQSRIDEAIYDHYGVSLQTRLLIENDPWVKRRQSLVNEMPSDKQLIAEWQSTRL